MDIWSEFAIPFFSNTFYSRTRLEDLFYIKQVSVDGEKYNYSIVKMQLMSCSLFIISYLNKFYVSNFDNLPYII